MTILKFNVRICHSFATADNKTDREVEPGGTVVDVLAGGASAMRAMIRLIK